MTHEQFLRKQIKQLQSFLDGRTQFKVIDEQTNLLITNALNKILIETKDCSTNTILRLSLEKQLKAIRILTFDLTK